MDVMEKLMELIGEIASKTDDERCRKCVGQDCVRCTYENVAEHLLANKVTIIDWISVKNGFPEKDGIYFTFNKKKQYELHLFQVGKRMWPAIWEKDGVTHWMPLPQPPKGE